MKFNNNKTGTFPYFVFGNIFSGHEIEKANIEEREQKVAAHIKTNELKK